MPKKEKKLMDTRKYIVEQVEAVEKIDLGIQSDPIEFELQDDLSDHDYVQQKIGVDVGVQIEDGDLFNFDEDVKPIVSVIADKVLEIASLEIHQEEEIRALREAKQRFYDEIKKERERVVKVEEMEITRNENKENLKKIKRLEREQAVDLHQKVVSRVYGKAYLEGLRDSVTKDLIQRRVFDSFKEESVKEGVLKHIMKESDLNSSKNKDLSQFAVSTENTLKKKKVASHTQNVQKRKDLRAKQAKEKKERLEFEEKERIRLLEEKRERQRIRRLNNFKRRINEAVFKETTAEGVLYVNMPIASMDNMGSKEPFSTDLSSWSKWWSCGHSPPLFDCSQAILR